MAIRDETIAITEQQPSTFLFKGPSRLGMLVIPWPASTYPDVQTECSGNV